MLDKNKKILFSAYSLELGGIETALVSLANYLSDLGYKITIVLEKKCGVLLNELNENIEVIEYSPSYNKVFGKGINAIKRMKFISQYKNRFDASFAYATYCKMAAFTASVASENCNLWVHSSYLDIFNNNTDEYKSFFNSLNIDKFRNIIFVSNKSKNEFEKIMGRTNTVLCNNIIDCEKILNLSNESIENNQINIDNNNTFKFLYVGRITEDSKKVSRLIECSEILKNDNYKFKLFVIGNGKDLKTLMQQAEEKGLKDYIIFLGEKSNPYPYFKISDALLLVSENEGYPVVFNEAKILGLPIITTDVSDSKTDIDNKFGVVCEQSAQSIADAMKKFIEEGKNSICSKMDKFDCKEYNTEIARKIEDIIDGKEKTNAKN